MPYFRQLVCLIFLPILLIGCGFHLRGHEPLPPQLSILYLQTNSPYSDFTKQLKAFLNSAKVTLVDKPQEAPITLQILSESSSQQLTSSGVSGQTNTYNLTYTSVFQLLNRQGQIVQPPQTVSSTRSYSVTSNQLLGDTNVQGNLTTQMQRDVIYQMLIRLHSPQTLRNLNASLNKSS